MSRKTATLVYKQTIMAVYCSLLYDGLIQAQHKILQYVQNRCLRICLNVRLKYCIENLHLDTNVDLLCIRFDTQLLTLLHKYLYGGKHDASDLGLYFEESNPNARRTRSTDTGLLAYPACVKKGFRRSPLYRGIDLWNSLAPTSRQTANLNTFKARVVPELRTLLLKKGLT